MSNPEHKYLLPTKILGHWIISNGIKGPEKSKSGIFLVQSKFIYIFIDIYSSIKQNKNEIRFNLFNLTMT